MKPQTELVLKHLKTYGHITGVEAAAVYKVRSLTARIGEIRNKGHKVVRVYHKDATGQRYAKYYL
jgi:ABC-type Fe3+-hydroxamate transport system substrate-binding protein